MTKLLMKLFIPKGLPATDPKVRNATGKLSGWVGIGANLLLFAAKFIIGLLSGSVSVTADAMNNLTDASSAIVTLIGFKLAEKPEWSSKLYDYAVIKDLKFPDRYYNVDSEEYTPCAPAVAEFNTIVVNEIQITLKGSDKYIDTNKFGEKDMTIAISEIAVLGGATK